eukprot:CAMPEP_0115229048 /NCGR_PEP_ID=MMETSP0270-20121206/31989_1 /TAXON_ID=71861 /ORGANISM="Scrippsiella trochoidea, Strain CCMP3099" /LENGTH=247 /DNA_ID=CAMNT_0002643577 /DNA_START=171 /DNA_END=911 /DNA_ORIENTATION=-
MSVAGRDDKIWSCKWGTTSSEPCGATALSTPGARSDCKGSSTLAVASPTPQDKLGTPADTPLAATNSSSSTTERPILTSACRSRSAARSRAKLMCCLKTSTHSSCLSPTSSSKASLDPALEFRSSRLHRRLPTGTNWRWPGFPSVAITSQGVLDKSMQELSLIKLGSSQGSVSFDQNSQPSTNTKCRIDQRLIAPVENFLKEPANEVGGSSSPPLLLALSPVARLRDRRPSPATLAAAAAAVAVGAT